MSDMDHSLDPFLCEIVARIYIRIKGINNMNLCIIFEVSFVTVSLMCVQVYDHKLLDVMPLSHVMHDEGNIWVNAKTASTFAVSMMITASQVYGPPVLQGKACRIHRPFSC